MNILDYVNNTQIPFSEKELCEGDGFVFSVLCHSDLSACFGRKLEEVFQYARSGQLCDIGLYRLVTVSKRFSECVVLEQKTIFLDDQRCHFSMTLFQIADGRFFLAARGTDDEMPGWLENIDFVCREEMLSQRFAKEYFDDIASRYEGEFFLGGHSKGGNLSVYAAAFCAPSAQRRVRAVYSYDGPGFLPSVRGKAGFSEIQPRVRRYSPRRSMVGMVYREQDPCTVIYSKAFWIPEHFVYNWQYNEDGTFVRADRFKKIAYKSQRTFLKIHDYMTEERCERLGALGTEAFATAEIRHAADFTFATVKKVLAFASKQSKEDKKMLRKIVWLFVGGVFVPIKRSDYKN